MAVTNIPNVTNWSVAPQNGQVGYFTLMNTWLSESTAVIASLQKAINAQNTANSEINALAIQTENNAIIANGLANFQGAWSNSITYSKGQSVSVSGLYYTSKVDSNLNHAVTDTAFWLPNPINDKLDKDFSILTDKTTPVDTDIIAIRESGVLLKKLSWANIKATLKTYFDTFYMALTGNQTIAGVKTFTDRPYFLSTNIGSSGAIRLFDAEGDPDSVYIQALNNGKDVQYGYLKINKNGTITPSGSIVGNITGNAGTATKLATARTINGVLFDGDSNISVGLDGQSSAITTSFTLDATHKNKVLVCSGTFNIALPTVGTIKSGDLFIIDNFGTGTLSLVTNGNGTDLSRLTVLAGEVLILQSDGGSFYRLVSRSKDFASNMNPAAGFTYLPNGMLMQWGYGIGINISPNMGALDITFPIAFPSGVFFSDIAVVDTNVNKQISTPFCVATSKTNLHIVNTDADSEINQIRWFAIGY